MIAKSCLLTPRQLEITLFILCGLTARETGQRLNISERTVSNHLFEVYSRLGIYERTNKRARLYTQVVTLQEWLTNEQIRATKALIEGDQVK
ncbi:MAG TPA: LuxR C-terminal-related transcriptional regulator [Chloroflexia bacterium]